MNNFPLNYTPMRQSSRLIWLFVLIAFGTPATAQLYDAAPGVDWKDIWWLRRDINGNPQVQEDSGEEWWYSHINDYDPLTQDQVGYLAIGYSSWINQPYPSEASYGGCYQYSLPSGLRCFETTSRRLSGNKGALARFDNRGEMLWCKSYLTGVLQKGIQTPDGGFIVVGSTQNTRKQDGSNLLYNPDGSNNEFFSDGEECDLGETKDKLLLMKIDINGTLEWTYIYGLEPFSNPDAYDYSSVGMGIAEAAWGYRIIGYANQSSANQTHAFLLDIDQDGLVLNMQDFDKTGDLYSTRGHNIVRAQDGSSYLITGQLNTGNFSTPFPSAFGLLIDDQSPAGEVWTQANFPDNPSLADANQNCWDGNYLGSDVIVLPVIQDCNNCNYYSNTKAILRTYHLDLSTGAINDYTDLGYVTAADLRAAITPTSDGGYGVVSTTRTYTGDPTLGNFETAPCSSPDPGTWDTDAYVIKLTNSGTIEWSSIFDAESGRPSKLFPGDLKNKECMFWITQADDGGLVISGTTSHNFDDSYLVKLYDDCHVKEGYTVYGNSLNGFNPAPVTSAVTWSTPQKVRGVLRIESGGHLTIDNTTIEFADSKQILGIDTRVEVEKGGKLTVQNGALLTVISNCNANMWDGIYVEGDPTTSQGSTQGIATINGSTVEHARVALTGHLVTPSIYYDGQVETNWSTTGGILRASNSTFLNCRRSVILYPYDFSSASYFLDCDFTCSAPMRDQWFIDSEGRRTGNNTFITLYDIDNVRIEGNIFESTFGFDQEIRGIGVRSHAAAYKIERRTDVMGTNGEALGARNEFHRLTQGIWITGTGKVDVLGSDFHSNYTGIALEASNYSEISRNRFYATSYSNEQFMQIYTLSSGGFNIEDNEFSSDNIHDSYGIVNRNSGALAGDDYLNDFSNSGFTRRISCEQDNSGLYIDCNSFAPMGMADQFDVAVTSGILADQGICGLIDVEMQTNLFAVNENANNWNLYLDAGSPSYAYNHHPHTSTTPVNHSSNIFVTDCTPISAFNFSELCPSRLYQGTGGGDDFFNRSAGYQVRFLGLADSLAQFSVEDPEYDSIQNLMTYTLNQRQVYMNQAVNWFLANEKADSAIIILAAGGSVPDNYGLIPILFHEQEHLMLDSVLTAFRNMADAIAFNDPLDPEPDKIYDYCDFYDYLIAVDTMPGKVFATDSAQHAQLIYWSQGDFSVTVASQAILNLIADSFYIRFPEPIIPPGFRVRPEDDRIGQLAEVPHRFKCYPNPALGAVTLTGTDIEGSSINLIEMSTGRIIRSFRMDGDVMQLQEVPAGSYLVRLQMENFTEVQKLIVLQ